MPNVKKPQKPRSVEIVATMGALGNVLALLSMYIAPIHPQVAVDLSHIGTFVAAMYCGPGWGLVTGALVALVPFYKFGVTGWYGPLLGSAIIPGKALTGLTFGFLVKRFRPFTSVILGFVPEFLFTYVFLKYVTVYFIPQLATFMTDAVVLSILTKAWFEMLIMAFVMEAIHRKQLLGGILQSARMKQ
jgi:riboflavin transporter FmnP